MILTLLVLTTIMAAGASASSAGGGMGYYAAGTAAVAYHKQRRAPALSAGLASPLAGVTREAWRDFVLRCRVASWAAVGHAHALGAFALRGPALVDVGLATGAKRGPAGWVVAWKENRSEAAFLSSKGLQYRAFAALVVLNERTAKLRFSWALGLPTGWGPVTLSGLLALLALVGAKGTKAWLRDPNTRERWPHTCAAFARGNGVF